MRAEKFSVPWSFRFQNIPSVVEKWPWYDLANTQVVRWRNERARADFASASILAAGRVTDNRRYMSRDFNHPASC